MIILLQSYIVLVLWERKCVVVQNEIFSKDLRTWCLNDMGMIRGFGITKKHETPKWG